MKIHFCTKDPCPLQDEEIKHILENGMEITYTPELRDKIERDVIFETNE